MKRSSRLIAAAATAVVALGATLPAWADPPPWAEASGYRYQDRDWHDDHRGDDRRDDDRWRDDHRGDDHWRDDRRGPPPRYVDRRSPITASSTPPMSASTRGGATVAPSA
ncbi:hypothetical protein [Nitrospirillum sp. BR 11163]|uniref:hypothetical protein n=1 Tax=Nitrospirillum sp. BR 11163 TaxID=3104323 RepID=UPI002AFFBDEE|nr:hypothetical protein [Nitrospirillum sp. BR 11163]MEA1677032.1 hypothetical protein [Nitrospirillum sp. BR 11163]